jgi:hypothetical protein
MIISAAYTFFVALFFSISSCSKLGQVLIEMDSMIDSCKVVPLSSPLYTQFWINSANDMIIEYTYEIPKRKYVSDCYIETLWGKQMYLKAVSLDYHEKGSTALLKAPYGKELNYQFACSVLLESTVHEELVNPKMKQMVITKNDNGSFSCHTRNK